MIGWKSVASTPVESASKWRRFIFEVKNEPTPFIRSIYPFILVHVVYAADQIVFGAAIC